MQKNVHLEKTHVNWVSVVGTGNEYPILSLIRFSPYMLPAGHERRVWAWNKSFQSLPKLSDRLAFQAPILSTGLKTSFKNYWQIIFTKSSKCLQNWSMLVNLNPNLDDVYHHPDPRFVKYQMIIIHHPFFSDICDPNQWLMINHHDHPWSSMIYRTVPHGAPCTVPIFSRIIHASWNRYHFFVAKARSHGTRNFPRCQEASGP